MNTLAVQSVVGSPSGYYEKTKNAFGFVSKSAPIMANAVELAAEHSEKVTNHSGILKVVSKAVEITPQLKVVGQAASIGGGLMGLNDQARNLPENNASSFDKANFANNVLSTAVGVSSAALEIIVPYAPVVAPAIPVVGQLGTVLWVVGMGMNVYNAYRAVAAPAA